jgi:hypothetical protein
MGMTHSDQFKPQVRELPHTTLDAPDTHALTLTHSTLLSTDIQQIAATKNLRFDNCDYSMRVHLKSRDTGSSRYYTILDFDGSVVGNNDGKAYILGSATTNWYRYNTACVLKKEWNVWACPKGSREISTLGFSVPRNNYIGWVPNSLPRHSLLNAHA